MSERSACASLRTLVRATLDCIQSDATGPYTSTHFDQLDFSIAARLARRAEIGEKDRRQLRTALRSLQYLRQDVLNILSILAKLDWMLDCVRAEQLHEHRWMEFAASDIDMFHVELRSAFDHVARILNTVAERPDEVPHRSFHGLVEWLENDSTREGMLGPRVAALVTANAEWFMRMKNVREESLHHGGFTLVFPEKEKILFQIYSSKRHPFVHEPDLMFNENVVDFERYAVVCISRLCALLGGLAALLLDRFSLLPATEVRAYHSGLDTFARWARSFLGPQAS